VLAHVDIAEKSNEIPAAQTLLAELGVAEGSIVTLDALHCQKTSSVRRPAWGGRNELCHDHPEGSGRKVFGGLCPRQKTWPMSRCGLTDGDAFERSRLGN
jgi:predicted transposase YbfD/YdcC